MTRILIAALFLLLPSLAVAAPSGVQLTPDELDILVSKDVGNERWAITLAAGRLPVTLTGNVFRTDGSEPAFLWCAPTRVDGNPDDIQNVRFHFECYGNTACRPGDCHEWALIAPDVVLSGEFFLPK